MKYMDNLEVYHDVAPSIVTLGKFDGLHRGHQKLIEQVRGLKKEDFISIVLSFDMTEYKKNNQQLVKQLLTLSEKKEILESYVDCYIDYPFTDELREMEAKDFVSEILVERLHVKWIVVGSDFRFGHGAKGDALFLQELARRYEFEVVVVEKEKHHDEEISSTLIKQKLQEGDMEAVNQLLNYPYSLTGEVIRGRQLGRTMGFPTANIAPDTKKALPPYGVYVCKIYLRDKEYYGMGNLGRKPTISYGEKELLEVNIYDFSDDIYGETIKVELLNHVRVEKRFDHLWDLETQIKKDREYIQNYIYNTLQI